MLNGRTKTCGLIGNPVEHTLSPLIHNRLAEITNINMVYVPFKVEQGQLSAAVQGALALSLQGLNITVPYKADVMKELVEIDSLAKSIGAVNTLVRVKDGFKGYNTDMPGLYRAILSEGIQIEGETVILIGAGGAARAVAHMLAYYKAKKVYLLNRSLDKAQVIADEINQSMDSEFVQVLALTDYNSIPEGKYLTIQGTSVGLYPNNSDVIISERKFYEYVKVAVDLIYKPKETKFMQLAKSAGAKTVNGLKMLLFQGIIAYELWNDVEISNEDATSLLKLMEEELENEK